jgi:N utilization substance protein A
MELIVPDDQLSVAIGRRGQNVMLTSELTGWKIKVKSESEASQESKRTHELLRSIPGVDLVTAELLYNAGYSTLEDIAAAAEEELGAVHGIGVKLAREIKEGAAQRLLEAPAQKAAESGELAESRSPREASEAG